jgi:hypothetical protein
VTNILGRKIIAVSLKVKLKLNQKINRIQKMKLIWTLLIAMAVASPVPQEDGKLNCFQTILFQKLH